MTEIIKSGVLVDGIEITSEHIGKSLEIVETEDDHWLPVGFVATIVSVSEYEITLQDKGGEDSCYYIEREVTGENGDWEFKWAVAPTPKTKSSKPQRQKLAKAVKEAKKVLDEAIKAAEEVGMAVDITKDSVNITFNPPVEEY